MFKYRRSELGMILIGTNIGILQQMENYYSVKATEVIRRFEVVYINEDSGARVSTFSSLTVVTHLQQLENRFGHLQFSKFLFTF